jgi:hypothetical protein
MESNKIDLEGGAITLNGMQVGIKFYDGKVRVGCTSITKEAFYILHKDYHDWLNKKDGFTYQDAYMPVSK